VKGLRSVDVEEKNAMKPFAIAAAFAATLTLAACGDAPADPPAAETPAVETPTPTPPATTPAPAAPTATPGNTIIPGTDVTVDQAVQNLQQEVEQLNLSDEEKQQAVVQARETAEEAARNAGMTEEQIRQTGDAAEQAARQMFGLD
jgi:type IV secretory pathway VirB10-like protein